MTDTPETDAVLNQFEHLLPNQFEHLLPNWIASEMAAVARKLERERNSWKKAHNNQVKLKQIISDRPDLKERAKLVAELIEERDGWREAAYSLGEAIPASWESLQPPAAQLAKFKEMIKLQHEKYDL
jgi:hypothetical protein